jgi:formate dehydrogenase subunit delta
MAADNSHQAGVHGGGRKLVTMANQIGAFFASQGQEQAVAGTHSHLKKFWDPRMRAGIIAHLRAGGEGLRPEVRLAVEELSREAEASARDKTPA